MGFKWSTTTVDEIKATTPNSVAMGPFGSRIKTDNFVPVGVPVIRGINLNGERFNSAEFVFLTEEKADELKSANVFPGDIVFTHRGTLGQVGIVPRDGQYERYVISQSQMKLSCDLKKTDPYFVFYFFKSPMGQHALLANTSTTGVPAISRPSSSLKDIEIPLPPLPEQRAIARILGCLDDKIELNRRMNQTLKKVARAIFKSWFVDFDPVRAKMEGHAQVGMDAETAALFPDQLEESEQGMVPKGWEVVKLEEVIEVHDSKRVPLSGRVRAQRQGLYPYYGAASIMDYVDDYIFDGIYILMAEDGSVIDNKNHPVVQYVWGKFWVNNHAHILKGACDISNEHLMLFLKQLNILPYVTGAVQPKLNQQNMRRIPFVKPSPQLCETFSHKISPLFAHIRANTEESRTLAAIRDALLPKLISGEIRVKDAEKYVEWCP